MAIFNDHELDSILEKGKTPGFVSKNAQNIKKATDGAIDNMKSNLGKMRDNLTKPTKKKKPVKETFVFDGEDNLVSSTLQQDTQEPIEERFRVNKNVNKTVSQIQNATDVETKKRKLEMQRQAEYDADHPVEFIASKTGGILGTAVGSAVGGVGGAVAGATVGGAIGGAVGGIAGGVDGGRAANNLIRKGFVNTKAAADEIKNKATAKYKDARAKAKHEAFNYKDVYRHPEFEMAMEQHFDITDDETRHVLLAVNEDDQSKVMVSLTSKLYDSIMDRVDDIDFGEIPLTKGNITLLSNYSSLLETIATMRSLLVEFKQDTEPVDTINDAINNIRDSVNIWKRAFAANVELPIVTYNTIVLSIIEATSYMLSTCVEFIKVPSQDTFQAVIDKSALNKSKNHLLFDDLKKFNEAYRKGQIQNAMEFVIKENVKNFTGLTTIGVGASIVGIAGLLFCIIPIIRELIFLFYYTRVRVSEYFDLQSNLLQMSAYNVENNRPDLSKEDRKKISTKQMKVAENFRKVANTIAIDVKESEVKATKDMAKESKKKYKVSDVMDEMPDSAASTLF